MPQSRPGPTTIRQAVILAGGRGERLKPLTDRMPKPLAPVNGVPFLDYLIKSLVQVGIEKILLLLGYKAEMIQERYGEQASGSLLIEYSVGSADDQTGRRLQNARALLDDRFILLYGDNYWPIALDDMLAIYDAKESQVLMTVFDNAQGTGEYGPGNNVSVDQNARVVTYDNTRTDPGLNGVNIGYFIVDKGVLDTETEDNPSFEEEMLPGLIKDGSVFAYVTGEQYHYITDTKSLEGFSDVATQQGFKPLDWTHQQ